jgi:hypothetical protein
MSKTAKSVKKSKRKSKQVTAPYKPTAIEQAVLDAQETRTFEKPLAPDFKFDENKDGKMSVNFDHPDFRVATKLLMEAVGTSDISFLSGLTEQVINAASKGTDPDQEASNFIMSVVKGIEPQDQIEAMLATQMASVHTATMAFAGKLSRVDNIMQQDSAEKAFNKLARTFTMQVEALNRHRGKGQQKVTVEHVNVHEGGQAIVGSVQGGGGDKKVA